MAESKRPLSVTPAGLLATVVVFGLAVVFVRLGFWQLDRLDQRRTRNAAVAERLSVEPLTLDRAPSDTAGLLYRRVRLTGTYDDARSIVWAGRSRHGTPGVHVLTPLRMDDSRAAVLVDRGWVPSPDAATVDLAGLPPAGRVRLLAVLLPLPQHSGESAGPVRPGSRTWFHLDAGRLREDLPYPIAAAYAQALPGPELPRLPEPAPPPSLTEGSHLSYALQWFGFAAIALIGWAAVVLRGDGRGRPVAGE